MGSSCITVLGAGSHGTALAIALAKNAYDVMLWGHCPKHMETLTQQRQNNRYLPDKHFPENLQVTSSLDKAMTFSQLVLIVVPSHVFGEIMAQIAPYVIPTTRIAWATKGLEPQTGRLLQEVAYDHVPRDTPLALLSGPTFAQELAQGLPTAIAVAATHAEFAREMADYLHNGRNLRAYINDDFIGMQLGGAVKNVIAIAAGISDGLGYGANARTALITRGLNEMQRLGLALGAKAQTFMGMSGLGDLVLTCTDNQSRNRRYGFAIGQGIPMSEAQFVIGQVVEGHRNAQEVFALASRHEVEMPIVEQVYQVLYHNQSVREVARILLARARKSESFL